MTNASAPYRFIPLDPKLPVQTAPVARGAVAFDTPLDGCSVSAVLKVDWTAMTPVCLGDTPKDGGDVMPLKVGERYCLSGTSLRGMLRSVLETLTFSHLGRINSHHHHTERDFAGMGADSEYHKVTPTALRAGWLRWSRDDGQWRLYPVKNDNRRQAPRNGQQPQKGNTNPHKFVLTPIDQILAKLPAGTAPSKATWQGSMSVAEKYAALQNANMLPKVDTVFLLGGAERPSNFEVMRVSLTRGSDVRPGAVQEFPDGYPNTKLYFVFTGPYQQEATGGRSSSTGGNPKQNEPLFPEPVNEGLVIPRKWMELFHRMNSEVTKKGANPRPESGWREWLRAFGYENAFDGFEADAQDKAIPDLMRKLPGIPVFWKGELADLKSIADPDNPPNVGDQPFWFSLSRVMRIPHAYSVGEVAQRLYVGKPGQPYRVPRLENKNGWDFARALFGWVDQDSWFEEAAKASKQVKADGTKLEDAQKGRVATGFAWAADKVRPDPRSRITAVFSNPRESFWPFYLRHDDGSGRTDLTASYSSNGAIPAGRKRTIVRQKEVRPPPPPTDNVNTVTSVQFLPAGTVFTGEIRVHNLSPVEFGALLFALTFGQVDGSLWHQIGRAKGFGYGALSPKVGFAKPPQVTGSLPSEMSKGGAQDLEGWMSLFETWMDDRLADRGLESFREHETVRMLLDAAEPSTGAELAGSLWPMELKDFAVVKKNCGQAKAGVRPVRYPLTGP